MLEQVFIFRISANSTVWAEPSDRPLTDREITDAVTRDADPKKLMIEERGSSAVRARTLFFQRFEADLVIGAVTSNAANKRRFVYRELERVHLRIRESGQGIIPSSVFRMFVQQIRADFEKGESQGRPSLAPPEAPHSFDVPRLAPSSEPSEAKKAQENPKNPFLPSDDELFADLASQLTPSNSLGGDDSKAKRSVPKDAKSPSPLKPGPFVEDDDPSRARPSLQADARLSNTPSLSGNVHRALQMEFEEQGGSSNEPQVATPSSSGVQSKAARKTKRSYYANSKAVEDPVLLEIKAEKQRIKEEFLFREQDRKQRAKSSNFVYFLFGASLLLLGIVVLLWVPRLRAQKPTNDA